MNIPTAILLSLLLVACASSHDIKKSNKQSYSSMTLDSASACMSVEGSEKGEVMTFSSYSCYQGNSSLEKAAPNDYFIRGFKDKKTGSTHYMVYAVIYGEYRSYPYSASYLQPQMDGEQKQVKVETKQIHSDVSCSAGLCTHEEHYTFPLNKSYLKVLSDNYEELSLTDSVQAMRILRKEEGLLHFSLNISELVGLYRMVEAH